MPQPNVIRGREINFFVPANGVEQKSCFSRNVSITESIELKEVFGKGLNGYRQFKAGKKSYTVQLDGLFNAAPGGATTFIFALRSGLPIPFRMTDEYNIEWSGQVLATENSMSAPLDDLATFQTSFQGNGKLNFKLLATANTTPDASDYNPMPVKPTYYYEPFLELVKFTYDGNNNTQDLFFAPKFVGPAFMNTEQLDPTQDYYYQGSNIVISPGKLQIGIDYELNLYYFK